MVQSSSEPYKETWYRDTLKEDYQRSSLVESIETEICVIGGGLAGLTTALGLAERGKSVVLLEANRIGWGASGRNGGFVAKGYSAGYERLIKSVGLEHAKELHKLAQEGKNHIRDRINKYTIDCGPLRDGVMEVSWGGKPENKKAYADFMNDTFDMDLEYLDTGAVHDLCKTEKYTAGVVSKDDFQFHPLNYVHGLAKAIEENGGEIYEHSPALRIESRLNNPGYRIETPTGTVRCEKVVVCCSAYVGSLSARLRLASFPVYTFVMVTKPLPEDRLKESINTQYAVFDDRYAQDYYRVLADNRILWGGRVSLKKAPDTFAQTMLQDLLTVYPQLEGAAEADYAWQGVMGYAPHKMPQIGQRQTRPGYWYCTCFGGHGLVPTSVGGEMVASAIADGDDRYKLFAPFSNLNFAGGPLAPYIAQSVYYLWRLRDLIR